MPALLRRGDEGTEVVERAEGGLDGVVAAGCAADRPRAADVAGCRDLRVVAPLAMDAADGMDGRQVEHVEAHRGDVVETRDDVAEGAVTPGLIGGAPWKHLVPAREARLLRVDEQRHRRGTRGEAAIGVALDETLQLRIEGERNAAGQSTAREVARETLERARVVAVAALGRLAHELGADLEVDIRRRGRGVTFGEVAAPAAEVVDPAFDGELPDAELVRAEGAAEAIVAERLHRRLAPLFVVMRAVEQAAGDEVVSVGEDIGLDLDALADRAFGWEAAADRRRERFDDDATAAGVDFRKRRRVRRSRVVWRRSRHRYRTRRTRRSAQGRRAGARGTCHARAARVRIACRCDLASGLSLALRPGEDVVTGRRDAGGRVTRGGEKDFQARRVARGAPGAWARAPLARRPATAPRLQPRALRAQAHA